MNAPSAGSVLSLLALSAALCAASLDRPDVDEATLASCLEQLQLEALQKLRAKQSRVLAVSYQLQASGATLCESEVGPLLGAAIAQRRDLAWSGRRKEQTEAALDLDDGIKVLAVVEGSPAARAGAQVGDLILAVDGRSTNRTYHVF